MGLLQTARELPADPLCNYRQGAKLDDSNSIRCDAEVGRGAAEVGRSRARESLRHPQAYDASRLRLEAAPIPADRQRPPSAVLEPEQNGPVTVSENRR